MIPAAGDVLVAGKPVKDADLDKTLALTANKSAVVTADTTIPYARVVALLDRLKSAGFTKVSLATSEVTPAPPATDKPKLALTIPASGEVFVGDKAVSEGELDQALAAISDKARNVVLFADASLPYARIVNVIDRVKKAGFTKVSLAVEAKSAAKPPRPAVKAPAPTQATPK